MPTLIVDQFGQPISSAFSRFLDAAQPDNSRPAWPTRTESIRRAVSTFDFRTILYASRRLFVNMGVAKGPVKQKADFSIGRSWQPVFLGADTDWGNLATQWLKDEFYPVCEVRGDNFDFVSTLNVDSISIDRDGGFGILLTESADGFPMTQRIPVHRFGARYDSQERILDDGPYRGCKIHQGIIYNPLGRPVAYRIYEDPTNYDTPPDGEFTDVSARDMIHVYEPEWYDQGHGFPSLTHALNDLRDMAQSKDWEKMAMLALSAIGLIEHNETGSADLGDPAVAAAMRANSAMAGNKGGVGNSMTGLQTYTLEGGLYRYFKANSGSKLETMINNRPGEDWESFQDRLVRAALYGINWPYSWWRPEGGGVDSREDVMQARASVEKRQEIIKRYAKRITGYAVSKAIKKGILPEYKGHDKGGFLKWGFQMPPRISVDDGRVSQQTREDYKIGFVTLDDVAADRGTTAKSLRDRKQADAIDLLNRAAELLKQFPQLGTLQAAIALLQQQDANQFSAGAKQAQTNPTE